MSPEGQRLELRPLLERETIIRNDRSAAPSGGRRKCGPAIDDKRESVPVPWRKIAHLCGAIH
jgi:hypothetical protein